MFATLLELQLRPQDDIFTQLMHQPVFLGFIKILFIICAVLYVIFSFVVVRQIALMRQTLITTLSSFLQFIGYLHLLLAILVVIIFFLTL